MDKGKIVAYKTVSGYFSNWCAISPVTQGLRRASAASACRELVSCYAASPAWV